MYVPSGNTFMLNASKSGYVDYSFAPIIVSLGVNREYNFSMTPALAVHGIRFVVNWGATPLDLDAHLKTPAIGGLDYHVSYVNPYPNHEYPADPPYASLDHDVTEGYGPETVTIYHPQTGTYRFFVHNYKEEQGNTGELAGCGAVCQVYVNDGVNDNLVKTYIVPTSGTGDYWNICTVDGATGAVTNVNGDTGTIASTPPA